jgi:hypothetical protein
MEYHDGDWDTVDRLLAPDRGKDADPGPEAIGE